MKFLIQFLIIIAFSFAGELLHFLLPLPIPASIYGIILLFGALELKWIKVKDIRETSSFLIAVMPVMFIVNVHAFLRYCKSMNVNVQYNHRKGNSPGGTKQTSERGY